MLIAALVLSACALLLSLASLLAVALRQAAPAPSPQRARDDAAERALWEGVPQSMRERPFVAQSPDIEAQRRELALFRRAYGMPEPVFAPEGMRRKVATGPLDEDMGLSPIDEIR